MENNIRIIAEKVRVEGKGVILLTGPSGCGKGEIAKALSGFLSIPAYMHLSMGDILRNTIARVKQDPAFKADLADKYKISTEISIMDSNQNYPEIVSKAASYKNDLEAYWSKPIINVSQFEWLEFCVTNGLLVPDQWTQKIISALFESSNELKNGILILDGYPRTVNAAKFLIPLLKRLDIPVIKYFTSLLPRSK